MSIPNPWTVYAVVLTSTAAIYYIFVGWKFYKGEVRDLFKGKTKNRATGSSSQRYRVKSSQHQEAGQDTFYAEQPALENEALSTQSKELHEHLITEIEEAYQKDYNRQDLIQMLQIILKEYGALKGTSFQQAVDNRIDAECAKYGLMHLSEDDKVQVWSVV